MATARWFRVVISYSPPHFLNKEIMSVFSIEFAKHSFVAAYLYAHQSIKDGFERDLCLFVSRLAIGVRT